MKRNILNMIPIIFMTLYFASCNKHCKEYTQVDVQNEFARSFFDFPINSYWVYSVNVDSVDETITVSDQTSFYWPDNPEKDQTWVPECYQIEKKQFFLNHQNVLNITVTAYESLSENGNINGFVINYNDTEKSYNLGFNTSNECINGKFIGTISIDSVQYENVYKIKSTYYKYPIDYGELYIAKDLGIIKIVSDDFIKELVNYKIN